MYIVPIMMILRVRKQQKQQQQHPEKHPEKQEESDNGSDENKTERQAKASLMSLVSLASLSLPRSQQTPQQKQQRQQKQQQQRQVHVVFLVFVVLAALLVVVPFVSSRWSHYPYFRFERNLLRELEWQQLILPTRQEKQEMKQQSCTIWMAPSSLPGNSGWGVYTTRDLGPGESLLGYADGVAITVSWRRKLQQLHSDYITFTSVWRAYWWQKNLPDHTLYETTATLDTTFDLIAGVGNFPNHHCILGALNYRHTKYDDGKINRKSDPTVGAITYNAGKEPFVHRHVKANSEVFLNYQLCNRHSVRKGRHPTWGADTITTFQDMDDAVLILQLYLWTNYTKQIEYNREGNLVVHDTTIAKQTRALLPDTKHRLQQLMAEARARQRTESDEETNWEDVLAQNALIPRSKEWIQQHGICMMNLKPGTSTIPMAGRGAFAQFAFTKGDVISFVPLLHLLLANNNKDDPVMSQSELLVNYCFRHDKSSLLLCPLTTVALMNHCSARQPQPTCPNGPNAAIRWATNDPTTTAWLQMSLSEIAQQTTRGLAFQVVALHDIQPGQEVFLDYGAVWEHAFAEHLEQWQPPPFLALSNLDTAKEANDCNDTIPEKFISGDLRRETIQHDYLFTACQYFATKLDREERPRNTTTTAMTTSDWQLWTDELILQQFAWDGALYQRKILPYARHASKSHWPCTVIRRDDDNSNDPSSSSYTIRIHQSPFHRVTPWHERGVPRFLTKYPRKGIHFFVQPGKSDQHLPGVFRHAIGIPDDMVPAQWKDQD